MKNFIFQFYPYLYSFKKLPKVSISIFLIIFVFLYIFRPFNVNFAEHKFSFIYICLIQSFTASLVFFVYVSLFNLFSAKWKSVEGWKIYKELFLVIFASFFVGVGAFLIRDIIYANPHNVSLKYFIEEILHAVLIVGGAFSLFTVINYYRLSIVNQKEADSFEPNLVKDVSEENKSIRIEADVKNDSFDLNLNDFVFAKAEGNYVEFYLEESEDVRKKLVRLSLKSLEKQLKECLFVLRTHRTFLINKQKITNVSGNALGYEVEFENLDVKVPVSRGNIKTFNQIMNRQ